MLPSYEAPGRSVGFVFHAKPESGLADSLHELIWGLNFSSYKIPSVHAYLYKAYTHICTHTDLQKCTYNSTYMYTTHACVYIYTHIHLHIHLHVHIHIQIHIHIHIHIDIDIHIHIHVHIHIHIHIHIHTYIRTYTYMHVFCHSVSKV